MGSLDMQDRLKNLYDSLTDEQKEKVKACTSAEEIVKFAGEEGLELPDDVLEEISGGHLFPRGQRHVITQRSGC